MKVKRDTLWGMKTENFDKPHPHLHQLKELVVGQRYQYKEDSYIFHFIFLGWDEFTEKENDYYAWYGKWDDGPLSGQDFDVSCLKDMTGMYYSGMPSFMPENTYMTEYNQNFFKRNLEKI